MAEDCHPAKTAHYELMRSHTLSRGFLAGSGILSVFSATDSERS